MEKWVGGVLFFSLSEGKTAEGGRVEVSGLGLKVGLRRGQGTLGRFLASS
ncbi:hypothetical protein WH47_10361 [Habropoda laboriosa]|uniref:Uncharacterized protein n=1 Tax=Habropoda laboriosa TaxID=597456 RepID=A0A0L7RA04_9HYME|nr:hypothetical protein WH47_10361 [Habropoda laboriosa]